MYEMEMAMLVKLTLGDVDNKTMVFIVLCRVPVINPMFYMILSNQPQALPSE